MIFISHRGNLAGKHPQENHPDRINYCLSQEVEVEIDVWLVEDVFYLGHDKPQYKIEFKFLLKPKLWLHCKNIEALQALKNPFYGLNCFFIDKDDCVLTSKNYIWLSPTYKKAFKNAICVMPEDPNWSFNSEQILEFGGLCSDNIYHYKNYVANLRRGRGTN